MIVNMKRTNANLLCLFLLSHTIVHGVTAQVAALNDDIVKRVIPVLCVYAAQAQQALKDLSEANERGEKYTALLENISAGKADPLSWLKTQSRFVFVPPSATYERKFSQAVSTYLSIPVAVYSFGLPVPEELLKATRTNEGALELMTSGRDPLASPAGQKLKALNERIATFYRTKKFSEPNADSPFQNSMFSPDSSLLAIFSMINLYPGFDGGEKIGDGPILMLQPNSHSGVGSEASTTEDKVGVALNRAGLSQEHYDEYVGALTMAKSDMENPSALELDSSGEKNAETDKIIAEMKAFYALRKKNVEVYRRYTQQVKPLLEALGL